MNTITLTLTDMANGGAALGRDENQRVVFVPLTIPGEKVKVTIVDDKKRFARGQLVEIIDPAPGRIVARCPHFGPCGGCQFQHIDYPEQLRYKESIVLDQLERNRRVCRSPSATHMGKSGSVGLRQFRHLQSNGQGSSGFLVS
jgi:23S rRNA (uracil1939-C5)-methyltransferase